MTTTSLETQESFIETEWADWECELPRTSDASELSAAIEREFNECVKEGVYPFGVSYAGYVSGGLLGDRYPALIKVAFDNLAALIVFYTAYCGGDRGQAISELQDMGFKVS